MLHKILCVVILVVQRSLRFFLIFRPIRAPHQALIWIVKHKVSFRNDVVHKLLVI